jgi:pimeloyl-ACP methyl ester carboxylesterase
MGRMTFQERLAHRKTGRGPDVLFLHGWPLHGATWRAVVPHFEADFTCHVIDLPGTGASTWTRDTPLTVRAHADAVLGLVGELGLERVALVSHDSGGAIARLVAAALGDRCAGVVLGNTEIPGYRPPMLSFLVRLSKLPGGTRLLPLILRSKRLRRSSVGFGGCFDDPRVIEGEFRGLFVDPLLASKTAAAGQLGLATQWDWSVLDEMETTHARIVAPVALIWGVRDPWFPLARARGMIQQFRGGAELVELPGKLFVHEEHPDEWATAAKSFVARSFTIAGCEPRSPSSSSRSLSSVV